MRCPRGVHVPKAQSILCRLARPQRCAAAQGIHHSRSRTDLRRCASCNSTPKSTGRGATVTTLLLARVGAWCTKEHPRIDFRQSAKAIIAECGSHRACDLTTLHAQRIIASFSAYAAITRYNRTSQVKAHLRWLAEEHGTQNAVWRTIKMPSRVAPRNVTVSATDRMRLMSIAPDWLRCWLLLCSDLAIRSGTAARLSPQHYNADKEELSFRTKFENAQTLPVTDELRELIARTITQGNQSQPFVCFLHPNGRVGYTGLLRAFHRMCDRLSLGHDFTPHDLRRTTAVRTLEVTGDLRLVQALLGHRALGTTFHYLDHRNTPVALATLELAKLTAKKGHP